MQECKGDLWTHRPADARVITTNPVVTKWQFNADGSVRTPARAVMGRGVALQAAQRYPGLAEWFGCLLRERGNVPIMLMNLCEPGQKFGPVLVSMPVKHHWRDRASTALIVESARLLMQMADTQGWKHVVMPMPGCGNGGLDWVSEVRPWLVHVLDDRFTVVIP